METNERNAAPGGSPAHAVPAVVRVRVREEYVEVRFGRGFTEADLAAIKSIPGRRWHKESRVWVLPHTPRALAALTRSFGARLVQSETADGRTPFAGNLPPTPPSDASDPAPEPEAMPSPEAVPREPGAILDALRRVLRTRGYSRKTERSYVGWARRFFAFQGDIEEAGNMNASHASAFLEHLAISENLAARSRNQAASALGFMLREILGRDDTADIPRATGPQRVPMVLSHREVLRVLRELTGKYFLIAVLLYSAGLRIEECVRLRVKDIDFELRQILVRDGKGRKDRYAPLARRAMELLRAQIRRIAELHEKDRRGGHGWAALPGALHRKDPMAGYDLGWQYIFPASSINTDPATGRTGRWPLHVTAVQREVKRAVRRSGIPKRATCHTFRHSFATESLRGGCDIRTLQSVMGHKDIHTTTIYLHVVEQTGLCIRSPLDRPDDPEDYDLDPVGRPWAGADQHWDLGARQWSEGRHGGEPVRHARAPNRRRKAGRRGRDDSADRDRKPDGSHSEAPEAAGYDDRKPPPASDS